MLLSWRRQAQTCLWVNSLKDDPEISFLTLLKRKALQHLIISEGKSFIEDEILLFLPKHSSGYQITYKPTCAIRPPNKLGFLPDDRSKVDQGVDWKNPCHEEMEFLREVAPNYPLQESRIGATPIPREHCQAGSMVRNIHRS